MHLFLSPHLDDAVLSCGGTIHHLTAAGESALVLTIMAGDPPPDLPDTPIVRDLHQRWAVGYHPAQARRDEDRAALGRLGAAVHHLPLGDCVYRVAADGRALYPSEESLFGEVDPADPALDWLRAQALPPFSAIYAPLGVGHHVDHQIVRDWGLWLARRDGRRLILNEEYPYPRDAAAADAAHSFYAGYRLEAAHRELDDADVNAKIEAIARYRSQISTFWADLDAMAHDVRAAMRAGEGYHERLWHMESEEGIDA